MAALDGLARVTDETVSTTPGVFASFFGPDPLNLMFVVILTSLGTWGLPQMVQKFYAITDESAIKKGTIISTVFALVVAGGCYFLGGFGRLFGDKVDVAKERCQEINPDIKVNTYKTFYLPETAKEFDFTQYDYVVDAIDTVTGKIQLVMEAKKANVPIISSMGAGNKLDPTAFEVEDI